MFKKSFIIVGIVLLSGLSGIFADRFLFPYLATTDFFQRHEWLKSSTENVTVINKTQQVYVKEESSVATLTNPVASAVVNIVSYPDSGLKNTASSENFKNGTGIIATSDGMIMTYASAIGHGEVPSKPGVSEYLYKVITSDGNAYDAQFVGIDTWSNLAFLKVSATNLPVVSFGDFSTYKAGEKVIAIGNDYPNYQNRFSSGIINSFNADFSVSGQTLATAEKIEGVFVADFGTEDLSVGGPVLDYSGQVAGIMGSVEQNGQVRYFQIPSDKVKKVLDKAIANRLDSNPVLGVYFIPITKSLVIAKNPGADNGAMIYSPSGQNGLAVISGSPAQKAGLLIGDIIIKVDDVVIDQDNNLSTVLYNYKKGDKIRLTVVRQGKQTELDVQL